MGRNHLIQGGLSVQGMRDPDTNTPLVVVIEGREHPARPRLVAGNRVYQPGRAFGIVPSRRLAEQRRGVALHVGTSALWTMARSSVESLMNTLTKSSAGGRLTDCSASAAFTLRAP